MRLESPNAVALSVSGRLGEARIAITGGCSPNVVQYRPDTRQGGGAGQTKDQREATRFTTPLNLQNLHPRFKSGRRLHPSLTLAIERELRVASHAKGVHRSGAAAKVDGA